MSRPGPVGARAIGALLALAACATAASCAAPAAPRTTAPRPSGEPAGTPAGGRAGANDALAGSAAARPAVHLIATGGTISNTDDDGRLTGDEILASAPELAERADVTVEQFSNIASGRMTPALWLELARRVTAVLAARPELSGVVVTHGTDTLEETAWFLDLVIADDRPVVLTGAMRNASRLSPDGPGNLADAVRLAADPRARGRGAMVVLNDVALPARAATKRSTSRLEAFEAPGRGPVAVLDPDSVVFLEAPGRRRPPLLDLAGGEGPGDLPRVDIVYSHAGADGALVDAARAAGARGIIMASVGRGGLTPGQAEAVDRAVAAGVVVVVSSRTLSGRVPVGSDERRLADWRPGRGIRLGAGDLTPQKARVLLLLALARDPDPRAVLEVFRAY